jgi:fibro-slime domain-containing protein
MKESRRSAIVLVTCALAAACSGRSNSTNVIVIDGSAGEGGEASADAGSAGRGGSIGLGSGGADPESGMSGEGGDSASGGAAGVASGAGGNAGAGGATAGSSSGSAGVAGAGGSVPMIPKLSSCGDALTVYLRDFQPETHPDFEPQNPNIEGHIAGKEDVAEAGIVASTVDANWKPVYAGHVTNGTQSTTGKTSFDMWFFDTPNVNMGTDYTLQFADPEGDGVFTFDRTGASTNQFFPLDDGDACPAEPKTPCLLGNWPEYPTHNFHMTMELHAAFVYRPGQTFTFSGDDDAWAFVNGSLVLDLGGIHNQMEKSVSLSALAAQLGLLVGEAYRLDFFWAERKIVNSNFRIETNIEFADCGLPPVIR